MVRLRSLRRSTAEGCLQHAVQHRLRDVLKVKEGQPAGVTFLGCSEAAAALAVMGAGGVG
jgi:hypothetical protein